MSGFMNLTAVVPVVQMLSLNCISCRLAWCSRNAFRLVGHVPATVIKSTSSATSSDRAVISCRFQASCHLVAMLFIASRSTALPLVCAVVAAAVDIRTSKIINIRFRGLILLQLLGCQNKPFYLVEIGIISFCNGIAPILGVCGGTRLSYSRRCRPTVLCPACSGRMAFLLRCA